MNKCRLRKLEGSHSGSLKYRVRRDMNIRYSDHINGCIDHLRMAEAHLDLALNGKNWKGLITNISNARYEVTRLMGEQKRSTDYTDVD